MKLQSRTNLVEIEKKVSKVVECHLNISLQYSKYDVDSFSELIADKDTFLKIIVDVEKLFEILIAEDDFQKITTVKSLMELVGKIREEQFASNFVG